MEGDAIRAWGTLLGAGKNREKMVQGEREGDGGVKGGNEGIQRTEESLLNLMGGVENFGPVFIDNGGKILRGGRGLESGVPET